MRAHRLVVGCALFASALLGAGCGILGTNIKPPTPPIPFKLVADGLSIIAFKFALTSLHELPPSDARLIKAQAVVDKMLSADLAMKARSSNWTVHVVDAKIHGAAAFPGAGIVIDSGLIADAPQVFAPPEAAAKPATTRTNTQKKQGHGAQNAQAKKDSDRVAKDKADAESEAAQDRALSVALSHEMFHLSEGHFALRIQANAKDAVELVTKVLAEKAQSGQLPRDSKQLTEALSSVTLSKEMLTALIAAAGLTALETAAGESLGHPLLFQQEQASDCKAVGLMQAAGFDPKDATIFWNHVVSVDKGILFRAHPTGPERIHDLQRCIEALPDSNDHALKVAIAGRDR